MTCFPKRPVRSGKSLGQDLKLFSNYFKLEFDDPSITAIHKYTCKFEPEIPDNSRKMRNDVLKPVKEHIK